MWLKMDPSQEIQKMAKSVNPQNKKGDKNVECFIKSAFFN
jgi:hypothetical protein